ncbi:YbaK/EbsC family protein [Tepidamorphus sp. 3E244]|uniref:YbaK/EbsC family protein n=1 Tax=Tepidamorphus sp. 3E244 TaxID=3385498 RepID=UPI0038FBE96A
MKGPAMTENLPEAAQRVAHAAEELGLSIRVLEMDESTRTADDAAMACGCQVAQIVKSLVFKGARTDTPYLLLVAGDNRVNETAMESVLGEPLTRPDAKFVRDVTGFAIGGVAPIAHATQMVTVFDQDLLRHNVVWAAAGTPKCVFEVSPHALAGATGAQIASVTE